MIGRLDYIIVNIRQTLPYGPKLNYNTVMHQRPPLCYKHELQYARYAKISKYKVMAGNTAC